jgi:vitamin B12 transporter
MRLKLNYLGEFLDHEVSYGLSDDENDLGSGIQAGDRRAASYRGQWNFGDDMRLLLGLEQDNETYTAGAIEYEAANLASYAVMQIHNDGLSATIAARRDNHDEFGEFDTYRVTAVLDLSVLAVRGAYGTGFRAPSLNELFDVVYGSGNPDLLPEESTGGDVGIEVRLGDETKMELAYFFSTISDLIVFGSDFRNMNSDGESKSSGLELRGKTNISGNYKLSGNYTYLESEDANGNRQIRHPRHTLNVTLSRKMNERFSMNASMRAVRDIIDSDFSQPWPYPKVALEDFILLNANAVYQMNDDIKIRARVENLLDEDYETALGFGTAGRAFYVGVSSSF